MAALVICAAQTGITIQKIKHHTVHRSDAIGNRYAHDANIFVDNAADVL